MPDVFDVDSLDLEARGVARKDGKVVFIEGALPGEVVRARIIRNKSSFDVAHVEQVLAPSSQRVVPRCPYFGVCGGCSMQHLDPAAQVAVKQRVLEDALWHIGKVTPACILPPLHGPSWGYRHRARLSVRFVGKKGGALVGFRERRGSYVTDMQYCLVLPPHVSAMLMPLRALVTSLSDPRSIPQIEVAMGDATTALVLRHLKPLTAADLDLLMGFGQRYNVSWWLQPAGPETAAALRAEDAEKLAYLLPEYGLRMPYRPTDFTQVNQEINRVLVHKALSLLEAMPEDRVADLFCGLGNFTLPLATRVRGVVGIEGSKALVERAHEAARQNNLAERVNFAELNLFAVDAQWLRDLGHFDRALIDPPREGAEAVARALAALTVSERPKRIVYVSCSPSTLARDAGILVNEGGYRMLSAGVVNMFPHTGHVESIAVFQ